MAGLIFQFKEVLDELDSCYRLADDFIAPEARQVLPQFKGAREGYREQPTKQKYYWQLPSQSRLRTGGRRGDYEVGGHGALNVFAEIAACWCIRRIPERKRSTAPREFALE